jgi:ABC-2 type transport system permease protein
MLLVIFLLPFVFSTLSSQLNQSFYSSGDGDGEGETISLPVYLVNEDEGPYGQQVIDTLDEIGMLEMDTSYSAGEVDRLVGDSERLAAIIIPANFSASIDDYEPTEVEVIVDPTQELFAGMVPGLVNYAVTGPTVQGEIQYGVRSVLEETGALEGAEPEVKRAIQAQVMGVMMTQLQAMQETPAISVASETPSGEVEQESFNFSAYFMPAFSVFFAFFLVGVVGVSLHTEKDHGTFRRLIAAPIHRGSVVGGNMIAYMTIVFLQVALLFGLSAALFGMPLGSSPLALLLLTLALGLCVAAMGLMIGAITKTSKQADNLGMILGFVLAGLGGALPIGTPLYETEGFLGMLSRLTPHAHAVMGYRMIISDTGELSEVLLQVLILLVMAAVFFAVAVWRLKWE